MAVGIPVENIFDFLGSRGLDGYKCPDFRFCNNTREIESSHSVANEETGDEESERRQKMGPNERIATGSRVFRTQKKPDGWGVRRQPDGTESLAFVFDYKSVHKISVDHVKAAVANENFFTEVIERVNNCKSMNDDPLKEKKEAEQLIAMSMTQVFDYMVCFGVAYGFVAAGKSLLLLHIDRADIQTLYCHVCIPDQDVGELAVSTTESVSHTVVAQLASFCLLSFQSEALSGPFLDEALKRAAASLKKWADPYEEAANPASPVQTSSSFSSSQTSDEEFKSGARPTGRRIPLRSDTCRPEAESRKRGRDGDDEEEENDRQSRPSTTTTGSQKGKRDSSSRSSSYEYWARMTSGPPPTRQYCTQACLLGLKRGWPLDNNCPNVQSHRDGQDITRHPIDASEFTRLVEERLRQDPYRDCVALNGLGKLGRISVLFKIELAHYGYAFVGKGTFPRYFPKLQHETEVYARLESLQGQVVPVHLGLVRLDHGYVLPGASRVFHMMLMSWGGEPVWKAGLDEATLSAESNRAWRAIVERGVDQNDVHDNNKLWNEEYRRVMYIDFERAIFTSPAKHKRVEELSRVSKKRKVSGKNGAQKTRK